MSAESEFHDLSSMNPTGRFSDRAGDYAKYRPDYPAAALDAVFEGLGDPRGILVADVGAGTGISARMLAERGASVIAIEPNAEMRAAAVPQPRVTWREGTAEATGLPAASLDLVVCFQAFHWFRPPEAVAEFRRVLRRAGRLALVWNVRDDRDELTRGYGESIHAVAGIHPAELRELEPGVLDAAGLFSAPRLQSLPHAQRLNASGLLGRATSASYVPREPEPLARLERLLGELHTRHGDAQGLVTLRYLTDIHIAEAI